MPTELTGTNNWRATLTAPSSGENRTAASVQTLGQDIADSLVYLKTIQDVLVGHKQIIDFKLGGVAGGAYLSVFHTCAAGDPDYSITSHSVAGVQSGDTILCFGALIYGGTITASSLGDLNVAFDINGTAYRRLLYFHDTSAHYGLNFFGMAAVTGVSGTITCALKAKNGASVGTLDLYSGQLTSFVIR